MSYVELWWLEKDNAFDDLHHGRCARATAATCNMWAVALGLTALNRNEEATLFTTHVLSNINI